MRMATRPGEQIVPAIMCFNGEPLLKIDKQGAMTWLFEEECLQLRARRDELLAANNRYQQEARDAHWTVRYQSETIDRLQSEIEDQYEEIVRLRDQLRDRKVSLWDRILRILA